MKINSINGRQYGYRSSALRMIRNFTRRNFTMLPKGFHAVVNRIDDGCFEIITINPKYTD